MYTQYCVCVYTYVYGHMYVRTYVFMYVCVARQPVKATSDAQLELLKSRIAEVKAQLKGEKGSTDTLSTGSLGVSCVCVCA